MAGPETGAQEAAAKAGEAAAAAAAANAATNRRRLDELDLPTLNDITRPGAVGALTGFIPGTYPFGYAGRPTFGALNGTIGMMGQIGTGAPIDPRLAEMGYAAGDMTLPRQQLYLGEQAQRWRERTDVRDFNASRSDADRAFAESQRQRLQDQANKDSAMALEMGLDPKVVVNGAVMPEWLQPHAAWAREYLQQNNGHLPEYPDLVHALSSFGQVPEDYNHGQPYPNQVPAAAPGILFNPTTGWTDTVTGQVLDAQRVAQVAADRWQRAIPMRQDPSGRPLFALPAGASMVGVQLGPNGQVSIPSLNQGGQALPPGVAATGGGVVPTGDRGPMAHAMEQGFAPGAAGAQSFAPSFGAPGAATAAIGQGTPTSQAQRGLIEQGRATDLQNALGRNAQRIQEEEYLRQNAVAQGNLDLARQHETNITSLQQQSIDLQKQGQEFGQGIAAGTLTGSYNGQATMDAQRLAEQERQFNQQQAESQRQFNATQSGTLNGQDTLAKGALTGQFNGQSTLAGQQAYGGSALVGAGLTADTQQRLGFVPGYGATLEAQQARGYVNGAPTLAREQFQANTGIQAADLAARYQGPQNAFAQQAALNGLNGAGLSRAVDAISGRYVAPRVQAPQFGGAPASLGTLSSDALAAGSNVVPLFGRQGGGTGAGGGGGMAGAQGYANTDPTAYANALPSLNQVNAHEYFKASRPTQQFLGSAYRAAGLINDQSELDEAARRNLPQFAQGRVPTFGNSGRIAA